MPAITDIFSTVVGIMAIRVKDKEIQCIWILKDKNILLLADDTFSYVENTS